MSLRDGMVEAGAARAVQANVAARMILLKCMLSEISRLKC